MKAKRKIIHIDEEKCNGCGECVSACAEGAIELVAGKARLVADKYCDGLAACLGECPVNAIDIIEREADLFDPVAVEKYLAEKRGDDTVQDRGCPSTQLHMFPFLDSPLADKGDQPHGSTNLTHWPVQIRLVPPGAPFLKNADLLIASDCTPIAYPAFHEDLLKGKTVVMGCPKFDDSEEYVDKFTQIFSTADIRSITIAVMEVPCCSKMPVIVERALAQSGKKIPLEIVVIGTRGDIKKNAMTST